MARDVIEDGIEYAGTLTCFDKVYIQFIKLHRKLCQGLSQAASRLHIGANLIQHSPHAWILDATGNNLEGSHQRHT